MEGKSQEQGKVPIRHFGTSLMFWCSVISLTVVQSRVGDCTVAENCTGDWQEVDRSGGIPGIPSTLLHHPPFHIPHPTFCGIERSLAELYP